MFKKILLATDGSRLCNESIKAAVELARNCGGALVGLSVAGNLRALSIPEVSVGLDVQQLDQEACAHASANVATISELASRRGVPCTVHVTQGGRPYEEIMRVAQSEECDAIFMASHAKSMLERIFVGSQAQKVLAHSKLPVLVFR